MEEQNKGYQPISQEPKTYKEWERETKPILNSRYGKTIINKDSFNFLKLICAILFIFVLIFGYAVYYDKFQSKINIPPCPNVSLSCEPCPTCPTCPISNCDVNCGDVNFPSTFNVSLNNNTG